MSKHFEPLNREDRKALRVGAEAGTGFAVAITIGALVASILPAAPAVDYTNLAIALVASLTIIPILGALIGLLTSLCDPPTHGHPVSSAPMHINPYGVTAVHRAQPPVVDPRLLAAQSHGQTF